MKQKQQILNSYLSVTECYTESWGKKLQPQIYSAVDPVCNNIDWLGKMNLLMQYWQVYSGDTHLLSGWIWGLLHRKAFPFGSEN